MLHDWPRLWRREFAAYSKISLQKDILAGITVAAVALPLALAFGVASGADAAAGLVTAILSGIVIGVLGGAPYQISGPTGAMSAVLIVLATRYGLQGVWLAGALAGIALILLGLFRLGRVVALIPAPVISGFTSGIALIIALGQIDNFLGVKTPAAENVVEKLRYYLTHSITPDIQAIGLALLVMATMIVWPRWKAGQRIPGSLVGIILASGLAALAGWQTPTIGAIPRTILLEQRLNLTQVPWSELGNLVVPAMSIAALGAIESLLCGAVAGNMTGIRLNNNVELIAQGIGNVLIPFFGGVPATAAIARTSVNIKSGGVTRLASILHGVALLLAALLLGPVIGRVPLAALAGVLLVTAWRMNEWHTIRFYFSRRLKHAMAAFVITLAATVILDLTQAILIGFGISTLIFMAQMSELQITRRPVEAERLSGYNQGFVHPGQDVAVYYLSGPLFFAAARRLLEFVEAHDGPGATLILSMRGAPLIDATGVEVVRELIQRQRQGGGDILLTSLDERVQALLERAGVTAELGSDHIFWSADKAIAALGATLGAPGMGSETAASSSLVDSLMVAPFAERMEKAAERLSGPGDPLAQPVSMVMRTQVVTVLPETTAAEIVTLLLQKGFRSLPVVTDQGRLVGIITDGDLLRRAGLSARLDELTPPSAAEWQQRVAELAGQPLIAANLMTAPVAAITPTATLQAAAQRMVDGRLKRLPVVDGSGRLVGWVSRIDILRALEKRPAMPDKLDSEVQSVVAASGASISDLMYRDVPTVSPQANLEEIVAALERDRRRRVVVVDAERRVLGIITDGDLLRRTRQESHPDLLARLRGLVGGQSVASQAVMGKESAETLMSAPAITINAQDSPTTALRLMLQRGFKRLPVVDEAGRLLGLLGRDNLLRGFLNAPVLPGEKTS